MRALDGVTLALDPGSRAALLGPNGAGKSTLLRLAASLLRPTAGRVEVAGVPGSPAARARVGIADGGGLHPRLTARDNLRLAAALYGVRDVDRRIDELSSAFGVDAALGARVQALSAGLRARVALARALLHRPALLLLDDVFPFLDPAAAANVGAILAEQAARDGLCVVVATHDLGLARALPRTVVLDRGRVIADGPFSTVEVRVQATFGGARA